MSGKENLLNFQSTHFGDNTQPDDWFVDPEIALHFSTEPDEDDGLGHYEDGTKRTLTDGQIAMFRRSELWQVEREQQLLGEIQADEEPTVNARARSPVSDVSSLEDELLAYASLPKKEGKGATPYKRKRTSRRRRSDTTSSSGSWKRRRSQQEVPYDQRHKRKWEAYVDEVDPAEGSLTHRRLARELDSQTVESVDMDY